MNSSVRVKHLTLIISLFVWPTLCVASGNARMYKINKKDQQSRIVLGSAAEKSGCHNLFRSRPVYRFAQIGFAWCSLYTEDDCKIGTIAPALWEGKQYRKVDFDETVPQDKLYPGSEWKPQAGDQVIQSWYCEAQ